jgi:hypothetical protein
VTRLSLVPLIVACGVVPRAFAKVGQYTTTTFTGGGPPHGVTATYVALSHEQGMAADASSNPYVGSGPQNCVDEVATDCTRQPPGNRL